MPVEWEHVQILVAGLLGGAVLEAFLDNYVKPRLIHRIRIAEARTRRRRHIHA